MNVRAWVAVLAGCGWFFASAHADEAAKEGADKPPTPHPPQILVALPLAVAAGVTQSVQLRGLYLSNVTEVHFTSAPPAHLRLQKAAAAEVPKVSDAKKAGDSVVTVELQWPWQAASMTNWFIVTNVAGASEPKPLLVLAAEDLLEEKEPNGGFRTAGTLRLGQTARGTIKESGDVDVYRFHGRRGQTARFEVLAARWGSLLDATLTLLDASGHLLATADDQSDSSDALLEWKLPADGDYFISLVDALDKGGPNYAYLLRTSFVP